MPASEPCHFVLVKVPLRICGRKDAENYVRDAVQTHGGAFPPEDPFFDGKEKIRVIYLRRGIHANRPLMRKAIDRLS